MIKFSHVYDIKEFSESYVRLPVSHHTLLNVPDPSRASNSSPGKHLVPKESQDCFCSEAFLALQIDIYREEGCHPSSWKVSVQLGNTLELQKNNANQHLVTHVIDSIANRRWILGF
uniref:Uncharacterized protein n=1 Tax=Populus davidiana TaxID=266767 RepID=A0A6M2F7F7_9ROSI